MTTTGNRLARGRREAVAVIAPTRSAARAAAAARQTRRPPAGARLVPMTIADYLEAIRSRLPFPLVLASDDRAFLESARERLLWTRPAPEVYDAISGLRTDLPAQTARRRRPRPGTPVEPYLLLEGEVTAARAALALASPVRNWVVEHVGRVRIGERALARLAAQGVQWSVLWPVELQPGGFGARALM